MGVQDWIVKKRTAREKERDPSDVSVLEEPLWPCFSAEIQPFLLTWATSWMKYELLSLNRKAKGDDAGSGFGFRDI